MSQNDATLTEGVSDGGVPLEITPADQQTLILNDTDTPRDQIEREAAQKSRASREQKMRAALGLPAEDDVEPAAETEVEDPEPVEDEPVAQDEGDDAPAVEAPEAKQPPAKAKASKPQGSDQMVEVLVDGVKQQMSLSDVVKGFQLEQASRKRFDEAAQMRRDAMAYYQAQQTQPAAAAAPQPTEQPNVDLDAVAEKLAYGNKDEIKAALETLVNRPAPAAPQTDPQATVAMTLEAVERRLEAERTKQDLERFATEYQDVVSDPDLSAAAAKRAEKIMSDELLAIGADPQVLARMTQEQIGHWHSEARRLGKASPLGNIFRSVAEQTRQKFGKPSVPARSSTESKVEKKRNLPQAPSTASARAPAPQEPRPKTPAEIIAEERKARGLAA